MSQAFIKSAGAPLEVMLDQLAAIEQQSPHGALLIYEPADEHLQFYHDLCQLYLRASERQRARVRDAIRQKAGILNSLLGYVYMSARHVRETKRKDWLRIGLAAASMRGDGPDFRDFYLALVELYMAALEAGLDVDKEFAAIGGGVPPDFGTSPVLKGRLESLGDDDEWDGVA